VELRALPFAAFQHLAQVLHGVPHVLEARVQRREAEAQDVLVRPAAAVALAEVAHHSARNQRLHDGVGPVVPCQADLRAALARRQRRGQAQAVAGAMRLHQFDEQIGQRQRLGAQRGHAAQVGGGAEHVQPALQRRQADDGLRAAQVAADARRGPVLGREGERRCVAEPAR